MIKVGKNQIIVPIPDHGSYINMHPFYLWFDNSSAEVELIRIVRDNPYGRLIEPCWLLTFPDKEELLMFKLTWPTPPEWIKVDAY